MSSVYQGRAFGRREAVCGRGGRGNASDLNAAAQRVGHLPELGFVADVDRGVVSLRAGGLLAWGQRLPFGRIIAIESGL